MVKFPIYLDHHSTTPLDPRVLEAMMPFLKEDFGNAAAESHAFGWRADAAVEKARRQVAELIGAHPHEIIFTSGATESNNTVIKGVIERHRYKKVVTSTIEHSSVLDTCDSIAAKGVEVKYVKPDAEGVIQASDLKGAMDHETALVSVMFANNEIGSINPIGDIGQGVRGKGVFFHSDLVQAAGRVPIDVRKIPLDFASLSAHKMYGPKGIGALFVRKELQSKIEPLIHGGGHEFHLRSGTLNVPAIVGFGVACELMKREMVEEGERIFKLREGLRLRLQEELPDAVVNGSLQHRLPGNLNISFGKIDGQSLLLGIQRTLAVSQGAACSSGKKSMSHVLSALGVSAESAQATLRFGIGRFNTEEELDSCAYTIIREVKRLSSTLRTH